MFFGHKVSVYSIPLEETINICAHALFDIKGPELSLTKEHFIKLLQLATNLVELSANKQMYKQLVGVAMGSLLGPTITNIFVGSREALLLGKTSRPLFQCKYVDDCFVIFKTEDENFQFHCHLNQIQPALQFTSEVRKTTRFHIRMLW